MVGAAAALLAALAAPAAAELPPTNSQPSTASACPACRKVAVATPHRNLILLNVSSTASGRIETEYERAVRRPSWLSVFGLGSVIAFDSVGNQNLVGFGVQTGLRFYPRKQEPKRKHAFRRQRAPEGFWLAIGAGLSYRNVKGNRDVKLTSGLGSAMAGWTGIWCRFALSLGAGVIVSRGILSVQDEIATQGEIDPWLRGGIGVAFGDKTESLCRRKRKRGATCNAPTEETR